MDMRCPSFIPKRALTEELSDVGSLKQHLRTLHGFPLCIQQILHHGLCLDDAFKLDSGLLFRALLQLVLLSYHTEENSVFDVSDV